LGASFDLSPFQGDPNSVVFLFQTEVPASDEGTPTKGTMFGEDFSGAFHVGAEDGKGSFDPGELPGSAFVVIDGNVDILGVLNGTNGKCNANPSGNCLDLIGDMGQGAIQSLGSYSLSPAYTYTIEFTADTGDLGGDTSLNFNVSLGGFSGSAMASSKSQKFDLTYTPTSAETAAFLGFASDTNVDDMHGPVLSNITLCAHKVGSKNLRCTK
jgi:hypothetical protein